MGIQSPYAGLVACLSVVLGGTPAMANDFACEKSIQGSHALLTFSGLRGNTENLRSEPDWIATVTGLPSTAVADGAGLEFNVRLRGNGYGDGGAFTTVFCTDAVQGPERPLGQTGVWNLLFADEFDGTSIDLSKWEPAWFSSTTYTPPVNDHEDGCYHPDQVTVQDGVLSLTAESHSHPDCVLKGQPPQPADYVSGLINSRNTFNFTYGYVEARIFLPGDPGALHNWPAFWTNGDSPWPTNGENDVMEGLSERVPCFTYHWLGPNGHEQVKQCSNLAEPTGWHTFAAKWEPGKITYFYDGVPVGFPLTEGITDQPHYLIANYGLRDGYGIDVPSTLQIDYIRVWALQPSGPSCGLGFELTGLLPGLMAWRRRRAARG